MINSSDLSDGNHTSQNPDHPELLNMYNSLEKTILDQTQAINSLGKEANTGIINKLDKLIEVNLKLTQSIQMLFTNHRYNVHPNIDSPIKRVLSDDVDKNHSVMFSEAMSSFNK